MNLVEKVWGRELVITNTPLYCGKILLLENGKTSSLHYHKKKHETFYVLEGECFIEVAGQTWRGRPGLTLVVPPQTSHRFYREWENPEPQGFCKILEVSTQHDDEDVIRLKPSGNVPNELRYEKQSAPELRLHDEHRYVEKVQFCGVRNAPACVNQ